MAASKLQHHFVELLQKQIKKYNVKSPAASITVEKIEAEFVSAAPVATDAPIQDSVPVCIC